MDARELERKLRGRPWRAVVARGRYEAERACYQPTTSTQAAARAIRLAKGGSVTAKLAVTAALGDAQTLAHLLGGGARVMWAERYDHHGALQPFVYAPGAPGDAQGVERTHTPLSVFADSLAARREPGCGDARELVEREGGLLDHATRTRLVELVEQRRA